MNKEKSLKKLNEIIEDKLIKEKKNFLEILKENKKKRKNEESTNKKDLIIPKIKSDDEEMMIGGGEINEPIIEPKEINKNKKYDYHIKKSLEERPRNVLITEEENEDSFIQYNSSSNNIISNPHLTEYQSLENVTGDDNKHNIPLSNENKVLEDVERFNDDDKTEKTIEQQPIETFESFIKSDDDPCCCNILKGWLFIKINAYVAYQIKNRIRRKRFEHWKKYSKIENKGNDEINTPFEH